MNEKKIKKYVLKNYKRLFSKKKVIRDQHGKVIIRRIMEPIEPIVSIKETICHRYNTFNHFKFFLKVLHCMQKLQDYLQLK